MSTMQPIRKKEDILRLKNYYLERGEIRNYAMIVNGLNIPVRISDLLNLKWCDIFNDKQNRYYEHVAIKKEKTGKQNILALNKNVIEALELLRKQNPSIQNDQYIFTAPNRIDQPLSRISAYLIIKEAASDLKLDHIGCHSLRKTFGYHAWKNGVHLAVIMSIFNHSSIQITKRYLGIEQEDKDEVFQLIQF